MHSLFDIDQKQLVIDRINKLTPETKGLWGKMDVAQMLGHCVKVMEVAINDTSPPRPIYSRIAGPLVRPMLYNEKPFMKSAPTAPSFKMVAPKEFVSEKESLIKIVSRFQQIGETGLARHKHFFFGRMTNLQWGMSAYKHLDHHLSQFGV